MKKYVDVIFVLFFIIVFGFVLKMNNDIKQIEINHLKIDALVFEQKYKVEKLKVQTLQFVLNEVDSTIDAEITKRSKSK